MSTNFQTLFTIIVRYRREVRRRSEARGHLPRVSSGKQNFDKIIPEYVMLQ
jgi:hypothetical protein